MNYTELSRTCANKFKEYDSNMCARALQDCHVTLQLNKHNEDYCVKLWAEIDAIRDRQAKLSKETA